MKLMSRIRSVLPFVHSNNVHNRLNNGALLLQQEAQQQKYFIKPSRRESKSLYVLKPSEGTSRFVVYVTGDTHLDNLNGKHKTNAANAGTNGSGYKNPEREHFGIFLSNRVIPELECGKNKEVVLVLNGDIIDFNISSGDSFLWDEDTHEINTEMASRVLDEIIKNNESIFNKLKKFLQISDQAKIIYVFGNHDRILRDCELLQEKLTGYVLPGVSLEEARKKIIFTSSLEAPVIGLHVEHCHRFDPFNYSKIHHVTWGDWYTVKIVNGLFKKIGKAIEEARLPELIAKKLDRKLRQLVDLRPTSAIPMYLQDLRRKFRGMYKGSHGRTVTDEVSNVIDSFSKHVADIALESTFLRRLRDVSLTADDVARKILQNRTVQGLCARGISMFEYWVTDSNSPHLKEVLRLEQAKKDELAIFVGGHSHTDVYKPGGINYFNPGAWKSELLAYRRGWNWLFSESPTLKGNGLRLELDLNSKKRRWPVQFEMPPNKGEIKVAKRIMG